MGEFYKDENGNWRCKVIHRMGRRCLNWDYCCDAVYLITLVLADRSKPILGRIELSELGAAIERHWRRIGEFTPEIKPLCCQVMPEHFHGVLWVRRRLKKPLGDAIRGFKGGCTKLYRAWLEGTLGVAAEAQRGDMAAKGAGETAGRGPVALAGQPAKLFADGYVDDILFDKRAFDAGFSVVTLQNKGFSPLYKPGGRLFDQCADGRLLMLAPIAWPYVPGEKKMTRMDACALNRIAQLICGEDAAEINYKGLVPEQIDRLVREAVDGELRVR